MLVVVLVQDIKADLRELVVLADQAVVAVVKQMVAAGPVIHQVLAHHKVIMGDPAQHRDQHLVVAVVVLYRQDQMRLVLLVEVVVLDEIQRFLAKY